MNWANRFGTGITALGLLVGGGCDDAKTEPMPNIISPIGDTTKKADQAEINRQYQEIYSTIEKAAKQATQENKKLRIVVGDAHENFDSLLAQLMILDAAHRNGVEHVVEECDTNELNMIQSRFDKAIAKEQASSKKSILNDPIGNAFMLQTFMQRIPAENSRELKNKPVILLKAVLSGMKAHAGDPLFHTVEHILQKPGLTQADIDLLFSKEREQGMSDSMLAGGHNTVGFFGRTHIPVIVEALKKHDDTVVVAFDTANIRHSPAAPKIYLDRQEQLERDKGVIKIVISGKEVTLPEATVMASGAILDHLAQANEITPEKRNQTTSRLMKMLREMGPGR